MYTLPVSRSSAAVFMAGAAVAFVLSSVMRTRSCAASSVPMSVITVQAEKMILEGVEYDFMQKTCASEEALAAGSDGVLFFRYGFKEDMKTISLIEIFEDAAAFRSFIDELTGVLKPPKVAKPTYVTFTGPKAELDKVPDIVAKFGAIVAYTDA